MRRTGFEPAARGRGPLHATASAAAAFALCILGAAATPSPARAGGFYLLERGTRALGRGGAQVAGADDPQALWMNPAGLGFAGEQFLVDGTMTFFGVDYTRIDSGGRTEPTVHGASAPLPVPTIAGTFDLGLPNVTFGAGLFVPNAALMQYPTSLDVDGATYPAPQRYSLMSMDGSALATLALGAAWRPIPELSIGAAVHTLVGAYSVQVALSACDGAVCTFPEDPDYDAVAALSLVPVVTAHAIAGVTWAPGPVRFGASVSTPFSIAGTASIGVRPPGAAAFDGALVRSRGAGCADVSDDDVRSDPGHPCRGTQADLSFDFPWILRVGAQLDAIRDLKLEVAAVWETWSVQQQVSVRPRDVWITDALGFLDYQIGAFNVPRAMHDTVSVRLGGEYAFDDDFQVRLGGYYENGAFDDAHLSALTLDSDKVVLAAGFSARLTGGLWLDVLAGYGHLFARSVRDSVVPQTNPIRPALPDAMPGRQPGDPVYVGNGDYTFSAPFVGAGVRWNADHASPPPADDPEEAPAATAAPSAESPDEAVGTWDPVPAEGR